jgi:hypothetical protein
MNLLHITTLDGLDSGMTIRVSLYFITALLGMFLVKYLAEKSECRRSNPGEFGAIIRGICRM